MNKIKTIRINCEEGEAELGSSFLVSFDDHNTPSYGLFTWELSECFFRAQMLHNEKLSTEPFRVSIIVPLYYLAKHKPKDTEIGLYRLEWYIKNMIPPDLPMIFTFYYSKREVYLTNRERGWLWPLQYQWDPNKTEDYVTVQLPEVYATPPSNKQRQNWEAPLAYFEATCPHPIKYIGYHTPIDEAYNLLKHTKYHFSYFGATYYLAQMMKVPSIIMGFDFQEIEAEIWLTHERVIIHNSVWPSDQIVQLKDISTKKIHHSFVENFKVLKDIKNLQELMQEYAALTDKKSSN